MEEEYKIHGKYRVYRDGRIQGIKSGVFLRPHITMEGDLCVYLYDGKKYKHYSVKKLIAGYFIGDVIGKRVVHRDGDKNNNHVDNLEVSEKRRKLSWSDVNEIRSSEENGAVMAKRYGVTATTITHIRLGHTWKVA